MKNSLSSDASIQTTNLYAEDIVGITLTNNQELLNETIKPEKENKTSGGFQPYAYYNQDMDSIQIYFKDIMSYTQPLSKNIELYLCYGTNQIVGANILRIKSLLNKEYLNERL